MFDPHSSRCFMFVCVIAALISTIVTIVSSYNFIAEIRHASNYANTTALSWITLRYQLPISVFGGYRSSVIYPKTVSVYIYEAHLLKYYRQENGTSELITVASKNPPPPSKTKPGSVEDQCFYDRMNLGHIRWSKPRPTKYLWPTLVALIIMISISSYVCLLVPSQLIKKRKRHQRKEAKWQERTHQYSVVERIDTSV